MSKGGGPFEEKRVQFVKNEPYWEFRAVKRGPAKKGNRCPRGKGVLPRKGCAQKLLLLEEAWSQSIPSREEGESRQRKQGGKKKYCPKTPLPKVGGVRSQRGEKGGWQGGGGLCIPGG